MTVMATSGRSLDFILSTLGSRDMTRSEDLWQRLMREGSRADYVSCSSLAPLSLSWDQPFSGYPPVGVRSAYVPSPACALSDLICTMGPGIGPLIPAWWPCLPVSFSEVSSFQLPEHQHQRLTFPWLVCCGGGVFNCIPPE